MRVSEALVKKEVEADMLQNLLEIDVDFKDGNARIWLRNAKFQSVLGAMVVIPRLDSYPSICPVRALRAYLNRRKTVTKDRYLPLFISDAPPFLQENKHKLKFYTAPRFSKDINDAISALGPRAQKLKDELVTHSLRSGISTTLQRLGKVVDPTLMMAMGRWHSMAYQVRLPVVFHLQLMRNLLAGLYEGPRLRCPHGREGRESHHRQARGRRGRLRPPLR